LVKTLLRKYNIIKEGHFILTSGKHSNFYINKDAIYCQPTLYRQIFTEIWLSIRHYKEYIEVVTGPAIAGAILAQPIASLLGDKIFVYPEKTNKNEYGETIPGIQMKFRRGYDRVIKDKKVWITEDIITTGGNVEKTIKAIEKCKGEVLGISCIWNRNPNYAPSKGLFIPLINEQVLSFFPEDCPYCLNNLPLQNPKE
jgi:orotate phosphoribosyltransferase